FDFRSDTPGYPKKDPDADSPTLRQYHKLLWSKLLPNGERFELVDTTPRVYLHHCSRLGEFWLVSDAVVPSFRKEASLSDVIESMPEELEAFMRIGYTIGAIMVFPGQRIGRRMTINGARGFHPRIKDRFDLTVECIRRHYVNEDSPLRDVLERYADFFRLFGDFQGYVDFFLLQDLVTDVGSSVKFFAPFDDFKSSPVPDGMTSYMSYRARAIGFIEARNERISAWWADHS
ncbi:MAG: hypothetical protein AB7U83_17275, partial [Vicinamibacterales bacterium]